MLVVDASVTLAWCFRTEVVPFTAALLERVGREGMLVPAHWLLEVTNVVGLRERQGRLTAADRARFFTLLTDLRATRRIGIEALDERVVFGRMWDLSQRYGLTSYDAAYLELARRRGLELATLDGALIEAASHEDVPLAT
ncbi:MAG: type II toxin-antitoxin system VapC family toxin [Chloroflexota bacterium]|nr:type II toxin-antitoxin system VapC family toxin [Chloroflexota bacterium]